MKGYRFVLGVVALLAFGLADVQAQCGNAVSFGSYGDCSAMSYGASSYGSSGAQASGGRVGIFGRIAARRAARASISASIVRSAVHAPAMSYGDHCAAPAASYGDCMQSVPMMQSCAPAVAVQSTKQLVKPVKSAVQAECQCADCKCDLAAKPTSAKFVAKIPQELLLDIPEALLLDVPVDRPVLVKNLKSAVVSTRSAW